MDNDKVFPEEIISRATKITLWEKVRLWFRPKQRLKLIESELPHFTIVIEFKKMDGKTYILDRYTDHTDTNSIYG